MRTISALMLLAIVATTGCFGNKPLTTEQKLDSSVGVERVQGVMDIGEKRNWSGIPQLINLLEDDDVSVRSTADQTLREMTGQDFGFIAYVDEARRREAVAGWRKWWNEKGRLGKAGG